MKKLLLGIAGISVAILAAYGQMIRSTTFAVIQPNQLTNWSTLDTNVFIVRVAGDCGDLVVSNLTVRGGFTNMDLNAHFQGGTVYCDDGIELSWGMPIVAVDTSLTNAQGQTIQTRLTNATNEVLRVGANTTNDVLRVGANCTNDVLRVGANTTNDVLRVGANCTNDVLRVGANATNHVVALSATNAAANGALLNIALPNQLTNAAGAITFTGLSGTDDTKVQRTELIITCDAQIVVTIPDSWRTVDGAATLTVNTTSNGVLRVTRYGNVLTNAELEIRY